jgi:hypothetical protein
MRALAVLAAIVCLGACGRPDPDICHVTPAGTYIWVGEHADAYEDIVRLIRAERFDDLIKAAPNPRAALSGRPRVCKPPEASQRRLDITYPSRRPDRDVGAVLELHLGRDGRVEVAEFYVVPLAL